MDEGVQSWSQRKIVLSIAAHYFWSNGFHSCRQNSPSQIFTTSAVSNSLVDILLKTFSDCLPKVRPPNRSQAPDALWLWWIFYFIEMQYSKQINSTSSAKQIKFFCYWLLVCFCEVVWSWLRHMCEVDLGTCVRVYILGYVYTGS